MNGSEARTEAANRSGESPATTAATEPPPPSAASIAAAAGKSSAPSSHVAPSDSASSSSPAQRLFTYGVGIILSFLPLHDAALAIRCCRAWLNAAAKEPSRGFNWQAHIAEEAEVELEDKGGEWVETRMEEADTRRRLLWPTRLMPRLPPSSLRHHIARVELRRVDWTTLQQLALLPSLRLARLTLDLQSLVEEAQQQMQAADVQSDEAASSGAAMTQQQREQIETAIEERLQWQDLAPLPRSRSASLTLDLQQLAEDNKWVNALLTAGNAAQEPTDEIDARFQLRLLHVEDLSLRLLPLPLGDQSAVLANRLLNWLRHSPHLSTLSLRFLRVWFSNCDPPPECDLSLLRALTPRLTSLTLAGLQPADEAIQAVRSLPSLLRIEWHELQNPARLERLLAPGYSWTQLEALHTGELFGHRSVLQSLQPLSASLTDLNFAFVKSDAWPLLARLTTLRSLTLTNQGEPAAERWLTTVSQLTHLTRLDLQLGLFELDEAAARILFPPLAQLHTLRLVDCSLPQPRVLSHAPALTDLKLEQLAGMDELGAAIAQLQQCKLLTRLRLEFESDNRLSLDAAALAACSNLQQLSLKCGMINTPTLLHLTRLPALHSLDCNLEEVHAEVLSALSSCRSLRRLSFDLADASSLEHKLQLLLAAPLLHPREVELQLFLSETDDCGLLPQLAAVCPGLTSLQLFMCRRSELTDARCAQLQLPIAGLPSLKRSQISFWWK